MHIAAGDLRNGTVVIMGGAPYRVLSFEMKGTAQANRIIHAKLERISDHTHVERTFKVNETLEAVEADRHPMVFLYRDGDTLHFMDSQTYEQVELPVSSAGPGVDFLQEDSEVQVELLDGRPVAVQLPRTVRLRVASAPPGVKEADSNTMKTVRLENGMEILAPQFIKDGDLIEVEVATGRYHDRVQE